MRLTRRSLISTLAGTAAATALRPRFSVAEASSSEGPATPNSKVSFFPTIL